MQQMNANGYVWVKGMLEEDPQSHYLNAYDVKNGGHLKTKCGMATSFGHGKGLVDLRHALKFSELCELCARVKKNGG